MTEGEETSCRERSRATYSVHRLHAWALPSLVLRASLGAAISRFWPSRLRKSLNRRPFKGGLDLLSTGTENGYVDVYLCPNVQA